MYKKTFSSDNFLHRNCILSDDGSVKVSDFAMGCSVFASDYSDVGGRRSQPIRWQPWETILLVRFNVT